MAYNYTSKKLAFSNAEQLKESFIEYSYDTVSDFGEYEPTLVGFVFIGNHVGYIDEPNIAIPYDTVTTEKDVWDNMFAAKKITGNDIELVAPRYNWQMANTYRQYDDTIVIDDLLSQNVSQSLLPMYVMNSDGYVYLCLSNNNSSISTVEPTDEHYASNGTFQIYDDGYIWKYLFKVHPDNKYLTSSWIPAPVNVNKIPYDTSPVVPVDGELTTIVVENAGSNYYAQTNVTFSTFSTSNTTLYITSNFSVLNANNVGMLLEGTGIAPGNYITNIDLSTVNPSITLKNPPISFGGGSNNYTISTRVEINGDGSGAIATANVQNGLIQKIDLTSYGKNYSWANINIYGVGQNASARAILPPKNGHGYNSAMEIGASNVMIALRIGDVDSTENGVISSNTTFRQYGFLRNPYKYGLNESVTYANSNTVISQTTNIQLGGGGNYNLNEFVYQGTSNTNYVFGGYVHDYSTGEVRLTRVRGIPSLNLPLKGTSVQRPVTGWTSPEFEPYTGDVLHVTNDSAISREDGQAELIRFVVKY